MTMQSAIFEGEVVHVRFRPRAHRLKYRVFSLLIDLDELPVLDRTLRLFGHGRRALFSFRDEDHGSGIPGASLKAWVLDELRPAGLAEDDLKITILCYPRIFGYVFNPLTVFFCHRPDGTLAAILYEVTNTFNERHTYVIPVMDGRATEIRQSCDKALYVSPFMPMECRYHFIIAPPGDSVAVRINETAGTERMLYAAFEGKRRPLTDAGLLAMLMKYPLMTAKVTVAIHWEALRLWLKRVPVFRHAPAPTRTASSIEEPG